MSASFQLPLDFSIPFLDLIIHFFELLVIGAGFYFTLRSLRFALDSRNVDFIVHAEGQIDPLFIALANEELDTIRRVLPTLMDGLEAADVKPALYIYFSYRHGSRIHYMLANNAVSLGMSNAERSFVLDSWVAELEKYDFRLLCWVHEHAKTTGEFNNQFVDACSKWIMKRRGRDGQTKEDNS